MALLPLLPARAEGLPPKEEVVYATLHNDGAVSEITVVNIFPMSAPGTIVDYGPYRSVENLSSAAPILREGERTTIENASGRFYYQGVLDRAELPWKASVIYSLNYEPIEAEALAGKSGLVGIRIQTEQNPAVNPVYYDNYMLQISLTLDAAKCVGIRAEGGTLANAGGDKQITFTVMPGKDGDCIVSTEAVDFAMDGISINAVPLSMSIDAPDTEEIRSDIKELQDAIVELDDGVLTMKRGVRELRDGAIELTKGSNEFNKGMQALPYAGKEIKNGSFGVNQALQQMLTLAPSAAAAAKSLGDITTLAGIWAADPTDQVRRDCGAAILDELNKLPAGVPGTITSLYTLSGYIAGDGTAANPGLAASYDAFHTGLVKYANGVTALAENYGKLDSGVGGVRDGLIELAGGTSELKKGTGEMAEETADMDTMIDDKINQLIDDYDKSGMVPASFTSEKNTATSVQFVIRTEGVEQPEEEAPEAETAEPETFWDRLKALF